MTNTMTLRDIAVLCNVERPLVSMWRKRESIYGRAVPFPRPVEVRNGVEHFDVEQVRDYLVETGRGKNPDAALEVATIAAPEGVALEQLIAMLCLRHLADDDLGDRTWRSSPPTWTRMIATWLRRSRAVSEDAVIYIDELRAGSLGVEDALLTLGRDARVGRAEDSTELSPAGVEFMAPLLDELHIYLGADSTDLVDGSEGRSTSVLQLGAACERPVFIDGTDAHARAARRMALLADLDQPERSGMSAVRVECVGCQTNWRWDAPTCWPPSLRAATLACLSGRRPF